MIRLACALLPLLALAAHAAPSERPATVLLITSEELAAAWEPFAAWKTQLGKATAIVTVEALAARYDGRDVQEKIRAGVLDHVARRGTRWVILGGDSLPGGKGHVPHRSTAHEMFKRMRAPIIPGDQVPVGDHNLPTDVYYISPVDKDWDADDDGVYGEWPDDREAIAYHNPKVSLGRIPLRTVADVAAYTEKVIAYESRYPGKGFARRFMYTNTTRGSRAKVVKSWDRYISTVWGGQALRFFHQSTPWDGDVPASYALNAANFRARVDAREASKLHLHGHGMPSFWVFEHRTGNTKLTADEITKLRNEDAYLVMTTVSCFTGQFDTAGDPCIAEVMLRVPKRGAVIVVAPSRPGVPVFHDPRRDFPRMVRQGKLDGTTETLTRFWMAGLGTADGVTRTAGDALSRAKAEMASHATRTAGYHMLLCELNLLGDPTLTLRPTEPTTPPVAVKKILPAGIQRLKVTTRPGLTVCALKGQEVYAVAVADAEGIARLPIAPQTGGPLTLTVSGPGANAVQRTLAVDADRKTWE